MGEIWGGPLVVFGVLGVFWGPFWGPLRPFWGLGGHFGTPGSHFVAPQTPFGEPSETIFGIFPMGGYFGVTQTRLWDPWEPFWGLGGHFVTSSSHFGAPLTQFGDPKETILGILLLDDYFGIP